MTNIGMMLQHKPGRTPRILLAEDDPTNQFVTMTTLMKKGFDVVCAANGIEACNALKNETFDLVLMDISMPEMDGFAATRKIRGYSDARAQVPIIALTALNQSEIRESCLQAGMDDYLSKPVKGSDLISKINSWLRHGDECRSTAMDNPEDGELKEGILDQAVLVQLALDTDHEVLPSLIQFFLDGAETRIENISGALEATDLESLEFETHSLGSSAATFGAMELYLLCRDIEAACNDNNKDRALELAAKIAEVSEKASLALVEHLENLF